MQRCQAQTYSHASDHTQTQCVSTTHLCSMKHVIKSIKHSTKGSYCDFSFMAFIFPDFARVTPLVLSLCLLSPPTNLNGLTFK